MIFFIVRLILYNQSWYYQVSFISKPYTIPRGQYVIFQFCLLIVIRLSIKYIPQVLELLHINIFYYKVLKLYCFCKNIEQSPFWVCKVVKCSSRNNKIQASLIYMKIIIL